MGDIITGSGTKVYIGAAVTQAQADSLAEFEAMTGWTEVGLVESFSGFGDKSNDVAFSAVGDARVRHAKGARDAGARTLTVAHDPLDAGQAAIEAAEETNNNYAIKVLVPDSPTGAYSDSLFFFRALVNSKEFEPISNDAVVKKVYGIGINSEIFTDPAST